MNLGDLTANPALIPQFIAHQRIRVAEVAGGSGTGTTQMWTLDDGVQLFAKSRAGAPAEFFTTQARGLNWLAETDSVAVPEVIAATDELLVLRWIPPGEPTRSGAAALGAQLAQLHRATDTDVNGSDTTTFGAPARPGWRNGFIGNLPLDNTPEEDWAQFYVLRRLEPYLRQARDSGVFEVGEAAELSRLLGRVPDRAGPAEPPSRIHGDLWSGNVPYDTQGRPWLVDAAAAHLGHRETDLATLRLFGAPFLADTLGQYQEQFPLAEDWQDRIKLHQLHLLLVHTVMFGAGYIEPTLNAARTLR